MKYRFLCILIFIISISLLTKGQNESSDQIIEAMFDKYYDNETSNAEAMVYFSMSLNALFKDPVNINNQEAYQLVKIYILTEFQFLSLKKYIDKYGSVQSKYELNYIIGFDRELIKDITPFIHYGHKQNEKANAKIYLNNNLLLRFQSVLQQQKGYTIKDTSQLYYYGNNHKYLLKYKGEISRNFNYGFTCEKDPGEEFFAGTNTNGFDFYSGFFHYKHHNKYEILLGDYLIKSGQGLICWSGFSNNLPYKPTQTARISNLTKAYTSTNENNYLRGISVIKNLGAKFKMATFLSNKSIDASFIQDNEKPILIQSFQQSGYHNTLSSCQTENSVQETTAGSTFEYNNDYLNIGLNYIYCHWDKPVSEINRENSAYNTSLYFRYRKNRVLFFGEESLINKTGYALYNGATLYLSDLIQSTLLIRYYSANFYSHYGNTYGSSKDKNETGIYTGVELTPMKNTSISLFADISSSNKVIDNMIGLTNKVRLSLNVDYHPYEQLELLFRYTNIQNDKEECETNIAEIKTIKRNKYRAQLTLYPFEKLRIKGRLEVVNYEENFTESGFLMYFDCKYSIPFIKSDLYLRYTSFNTASFKSAIYAYENDLLYNFRVPAYAGEGTSFYILFNYHPNRNLKFQAKYAAVKYEGVDKVLSGLNEISGDMKSDLKIQLILGF